MHGDLAKEKEQYNSRPKDPKTGGVLLTVPEPPKVRGLVAQEG